MILVTGAARSGTSLTSKILQAHGVWLGRRGEVNELFEHVSIRQRVLKPMLAAAGADPLGQRKLPDTDSLKPVPGLRGRVERMLGTAKRQSAVAYKDAKLCLVWPVWAAAFPDAKWIVVRRDPEEIAASCLRTHFMRAYDTREGWLGWVAEHEKRFEAMKAAGVDLIEVWPKDFIADAEGFRAVAEHCGLAFDAAAVDRAIDPGRWRGTRAASVVFPTSSDRRRGVMRMPRRH